MNFDWSRYLTLAKELAGPGTNPSPDEAKLRCAISRAYYANYCMARNHLRDKEGHRIPREDSHRYVIEQFINSSDRKRTDLGKDLNRLKISRTMADYDDEFPGTGPSTIVALRLADSVMAKLGEL
jgi:hypothetical protein